MRGRVRTHFQGDRNSVGESSRGGREVSYKGRNGEKEIMMLKVGEKCLSLTRFWYISMKGKPYIFLITTVVSGVRTQ